MVWWEYPILIFLIFFGYYIAKILYDILKYNYDGLNQK